MLGFAQATFLRCGVSHIRHTPFSIPRRDLHVPNPFRWQSTHTRVSPLVWGPAFVAVLTAFAVQPTISLDVEPSLGENEVTIGVCSCYLSECIADTRSY